MRKTLLIIILFTTINNIYSQHSERFIELTENISPFDSIVKVKKYKNGNLREITRYHKYELGEYWYERIYGTNQLYSKDGTLLFEQVYDNFGNLLLERRINENGLVYKIKEVESIDTKANSLEQLLNSDKELIHIVSDKEYLILKESNELLLWKEGKRKNGKKTGIWKKHNNCDGTIKIKDILKNKRCTTPYKIYAIFKEKL